MVLFEYHATLILDEMEIPENHVVEQPIEYQALDGCP